MVQNRGCHAQGGVPLVLERVRVDRLAFDPPYKPHNPLVEQKASGLNSAKLGNSEPVFSLETPEWLKLTDLL